MITMPTLLFNKKRIIKKIYEGCAFPKTTEKLVKENVLVNTNDRNCIETPEIWCFSL